MLELDLEIGTSTPSAPLTGTVEPATPATLVTVEAASVQTVFTTAGALDPLIAQVTAAVRAHKPDVSTAKGREAIASLAFKVAKTKTYLDGLGKALVDDLKALPKKIDASRLDLRTRLDALRDEARKPLDEWEAEQARIAAEEKALRAAEELAAQVERDHEVALLMDAAFDREKADRIRKEDEARLAREEQIRREASERARIEAETRAKIEREDAIRKELEAKQALERAEREKAEAEQRAKDAEARRVREQQEAEAREERARQEAAEQERRRQEAEIAAQKAEQARREADQEHRRTFNREALADLMTAGVSEEVAKAVILAVAAGKIRHMKVEY